MPSDRESTDIAVSELTSNRMTTETRIDRPSFAHALAFEPSGVDDRTSRLLAEANLRYRTLDETAQAELEGETARKIAEGFSVVGEHRAGIWRDAWQDQLDRFERSNYALAALNPEFVAGSSILRWQGAYVEAVTGRFELVFLEVLRDWLFHTYLADVERLYEFGSGSAFNVAAYAGLFPNVPIVALDWAPAAVRIADLLRERRGLNINGERFDFFAPQRGAPLGAGSGVLTMCALEQTGERFGAFLNYLISERPLRVVHVEPIVELYDPSVNHDRLAIAYHTQRKYLTGLLPALQELAANGVIRIPYVRRLRFGSRFHECFTIIVWEPL